MGEHSVAVLLDIQGAFDNVCPDLLIQDLADIGVSVKCRKFVENLTSMRKIFVVKEGELQGPFFRIKASLRVQLLVRYCLISISG